MNLKTKLLNKTENKFSERLHEGIITRFEHLKKIRESNKSLALENNTDDENQEKKLEN